MPPQDPPAEPLISRQAWIMLGGAFLIFTLGASIMHAYTVFLLALIAEFGWSRAQASLAYSTGQLVAGLTSPLVGGLTDRLGPRRVVLLGSALLVVGLIGSAMAGQLWQVIGLYGVVMTLGANCLGLLVFVPLLSRLFVRRRGMAVSILQSANAFGRALSAPSSQLLVDGVGWRAAYGLQAGLVAALMVPFFFFFRVPPAPSAADGAMKTASGRPWTLRTAMRTQAFWLLFLVYMFTSIGTFLLSLHQIAFAVDIGFDPLYVAGVLGASSLLALPGVIITGTLSDYIGREWSAILAYGISILGVIFALLLHSPDQHLMLWLHGIFFGVTWGARGPAITAKTADLFGGPSLGTILGVITVGSGIGAGLGSWGAGFIHDLTGSYRIAFWLSIAAYGCGTIAFWLLRSRR
jgi:MFS family permease